MLTKECEQASSMRLTAVSISLFWATFSSEGALPKLNCPPETAETILESPPLNFLEFNFEGELHSAFNLLVLCMISFTSRLIATN